MKRNKILLILGVMLMLINLFGCEKEEPIIDGGEIDNTDHNAPKVINSKNIISFDTTFYLIRDDILDDNYTGLYHFTIEDNVLTEDSLFNASTSVDSLTLNKLQVIIDDNNLVELNGLDNYTSGLPVEYQPCYFTTKYDSDEKLYFCEDNDPYAKWANEVFELFRQIFIDAGNEELKPSKEATTITNFEFSFLFDDVDYNYAITTLEDGTTRLMKTTSKMDDDSSINMEVADASDELYTELSALVIDLGLKRFNIDSSEDIEDDAEGKDYYAISIDFENGKQIYGDTSNLEKVLDFQNEASKIIAFFDDYMSRHNKQVFY